MTDRKAERDARLAEALRLNLHRRKARDRALAQEPAPRVEDAGTAGPRDDPAGE